jgi:preprotein translocase subunit SecG
MLLAEMNWSQLLLGLLIIGVSFFLVVVILLQRGRGGGLAGAFGGGGGSGTFGAKTGDVFTWITVAFAGVFLLLAIFANFVFDQSDFALANPAVAAPATPPDGGAAVVPTEGTAPEGMKIEMITEDGKVVPANVDFKIGTPAGPGQPSEGQQPLTAPAQQPATDPGAATQPPPSEPPAAQPETPPPGGETGQGNDNKAPEEPKDPGR